jgi:hypothetical protein
MKRQPPPENTPRVIALAIAAAGALGATAWASDLFSKLSPDESAALALFLAGFAVLTYFADPQVRAVVNGAIATLRGRFARRGRTRGRPGHIRT